MKKKRLDWRCTGFPVAFAAETVVTDVHTYRILKHIVDVDLFVWQLGSDALIPSLRSEGRKLGALSFVMPCLLAEVARVLKWASPTLRLLSFAAFASLSFTFAWFAFALSVTFSFAFRAFSEKKRMRSLSWRSFPFRGVQFVTSISQ